MERHRSGKSGGDIPVAPEEADELRSIHFSSKQLHETFVLDYGFIAVTRV
jgi:hypothetical protein